MISYVLVLGFALGLRGYLTWLNKWRDFVEEGVHVPSTTVGGNKGSRVETTPVPGEQENLDDDETDFRTVGFRYRM